MRQLTQGQFAQVIYARVLITEWAALGVACAVMKVYTGMCIQTVAGHGDRFDYWVSDGNCRWGLEISGTATKEAENRHRQKLIQLRKNPVTAGGFVVIVDFATKTVLLSFNSPIGVVG
jgi:hypothetical protein